jgi:hypothetical protein
MRRALEAAYARPLEDGAPEKLFAASGQSCPPQPIGERMTMATKAERPWEPHERNYSGGRFGVWHDEEWTMLRVEAGVNDATVSIRKHEAYDLAQRLSPALVERVEYLFAEMKKAQHALHQFTWADTLAPTLRKVADEWDCDSSQCEFASSDMGGLSCPHIESERGCRAVEADEMRQFADALEYAETLRTRPLTGEVTEEMLDVGEAAYDAVPEGFNAHRTALGKVYLAMSNASRGNGNG